jgi:hypothetical protein
MEGMSEKRYLISEDWGIYPHSAKDTITESELKKRLQEIIEADHPMENCIDILLHGEGKEPEQDKQVAVCKHYDKRLIGKDIYCNVCGVCLHTEKEPPPDAWEKWASKLAHALITERFGSYTAQEERVKQLFLEMPR